MLKNIGIDIGGTKILMGVINENGELLAERQIATKPQVSPKEMISEIAGEVQIMLKEKGYSMNDIHFIGVGVPGTVETKTGMVDYCPNIGWMDVPAGLYFKEMLGRDVLISQDSRLAALGENLFGAGVGYHDLVCITLGTGIGCGIIAQDKIFHGGMNTAGELGHIIIVPDGRPCPCKRRGCLERYSSGTGILLGAREMFPEKLNPDSKTEDVFNLAYCGDSMALGLIEDCLDKLAFGIAMMVNILSPEIIIISGGLCRHEKLIIEPLKNKIYRYGYIAWTRKKDLRVTKALLEDKAAVIGASALYRGI